MCRAVKVYTLLCVCFDIISYTCAFSIGWLLVENADLLFLHVFWLSCIYPSQTVRAERKDSMAHHGSSNSNNNGGMDHKSYEMREDLDQAGKIDDPLIANPATQAIPAKVVRFERTLAILRCWSTYADPAALYPGSFAILLETNAAFLGDNPMQRTYRNPRSSTQRSSSASGLPCRAASCVYVPYIELGACADCLSSSTDPTDPLQQSHSRTRRRITFRVFAQLTPYC